MSRLELKCKPIIGSLLEDISISLDPDYQKALVEWALKGAMIIDAESTKPRLFRDEECHNFKKTRAIPNGTGVWIGRFTGRSLSAINGGATLQGEDGVSVARIHVFTALVGHLAMQVLSVHEEPGSPIATLRLACTDGRWNELLLQIWPRVQKTVQWPPPLSFDHYGSNGAVPYGSLVYRWKRESGHNVVTKSPRTESNVAP